MEDVFKQILVNLEHVGIGVLLFLIAYGSNIGYSIYLNTKILGQRFDKGKLINSALKIVSFTISTTLLCIAITSVPIFSNYVGFVIPKEYSEVFEKLTVLSVFLLSTCQYIIESYNKMKQILKAKTSKEETSDITISK